MANQESTSVTADIFRGFRLGVITIFGILLPGVWFWMSLSLYALGAWGLESNYPIIALFRNQWVSPTLLWIIGFVLVYVVGAQLRAFQPDKMDHLSIRWLHWVNPDWPIERDDTFPYRSLPKYFMRNQMQGFVWKIPWREEGMQGTCSTLFVNYSKLCVANKAPKLGDYLDREEAFIRAMSGVAWGTIFSTAIGICFTVCSLWTRNQGFSGSMVVVAFVTNVLILISIIVNLHRHRLREMTKLVGALHFVFHDCKKTDMPYGDYDPNYDPDVESPPDGCDGTS